MKWPVRYASPLATLIVILSTINSSSKEWRLCCTNIQTAHRFERIDAYNDYYFISQLYELDWKPRIRI
jgi:hypothetical protein